MLDANRGTVMPLASMTTGAAATLRADYPESPLLLDVLQNLSSCYVKLGWVDSALDTAREIWKLKIRRSRTVQT